MSTPPLHEPLVILDGRDVGPTILALDCGTVAIHSRVCPGKEGPNEDALAVLTCSDGRAVLVVADGFGGHPAGDQAARLAVETMRDAVALCADTRGDLRDAILDGFEAANRAVTALGVGAANTLAVAEFDNGVVRPYHVGDSEIMIVGQRGKLKLQTVSHSPVGYAVEAGLIDRDDAMHHDERNIVSNMVGSPQMRIEVGPRVALRPRDTLILATDGLFDNLGVPEIVELIRKGPLETACTQLRDACRDRMLNPQPDQPSKPDDTALVLFRR
ncbi:MAG: protein phosphatase 2C domain-containing protein [Phycisphaerae bacterium]|jgi:serine/threonine protein phosphatase PrpC